MFQHLVAHGQTWLGQTWLTFTAAQSYVAHLVAPFRHFGLPPVK